VSQLSLAGVSVAVAGRLLLSRVALTLPAGGCLALTGPSGLGKTRLLRAIAALDPALDPAADPAAGSPTPLLFAGRSPADWGYPAWRRTVLLVQQRGVMLAGTVRANLAAPFALAVAAAQPRPQQGRYDAVLRELGLDIAVLDQEAARLSIGQAQRVSLARALLSRPRVYLLDEPTAGLDPAATRLVEAAIRAACAAGASALVVSHDPAQPARLGAATLDLSRFAPLLSEVHHDR